MFFKVTNYLNGKPAIAAESLCPTDRNAHGADEGGGGYAQRGYGKSKQLVSTLLRHAQNNTQYHHQP
jgi:hypothetical protein